MKQDLKQKLQSLEPQLRDVELALCVLLTALFVSCVLLGIYAAQPM